MFTPQEAQALDKMLTSPPEPKQESFTDYGGEKVPEDEKGWQTPDGFVPEKAAIEYMEWLYGYSLPLHEW